MGLDVHLMASALEEHAASKLEMFALAPAQLRAAQLPVQAHAMMRTPRAARTISQPAKQILPAHKGFHNAHLFLFPLPSVRPNLNFPFICCIEIKPA